MFIKRTNESITRDPREILLSLIDIGSLNIEDVVLACVKEMTDTQCKRILNSLSLPSNSEEVPLEELSDEEVEKIPDADTDDSAVEDEETEAEAESEPVPESKCRKSESRLNRTKRCMFKVRKH